MPDPLGRACIFPGDSKDAVTAVDVCIVRTGESGVDHRWLMFTTNSLPIRSTIASLQSGSTRKRISRKNLAKIIYPLPPLSEQKLIVAKIEELFTKLDAGVEALKKVQLELKCYRQAVLKYAFEGKLTTEWRDKNKDKLEPASKLLERIAKEREKSAKGKKQKKLPLLDISELPELPPMWTWTTIEYLRQNVPNAIKAGPFGSDLKKKYYVAQGYKIYGQEQVIRGDVSYGDYYIDEERYQMLKSCRVKAGDILISLVGTIGRTLVLPENIEPGIINPRLVKMSLDNRAVRPRYLQVYLMSLAVRYYFSIASHGGTMDILNLTILKKLPIALPPLIEQDVLLGEIDRHLSIADEIEQTIEQSLKQSDRLRQSILKIAFEGKLVPQDPADEPAEKLLERIKTEKRRLYVRQRCDKKD